MLLRVQNEQIVLVKILDSQCEMVGTRDVESYLHQVSSIKSVSSLENLGSPL